MKLFVLMEGKDTQRMDLMILFIIQRQLLIYLSTSSDVNSSLEAAWSTYIKGFKLTVTGCASTTSSGMGPTKWIVYTPACTCRPYRICTRSCILVTTNTMPIRSYVLSDGSQETMRGATLTEHIRRRGCLSLNMIIQRLN
uniref:Uncharacterized protein n=1 Tax=Cacopsylla melanoneura TaxID=428564 RepID=A0A8D8TDI3_9HEMI